MNAVGAHISDSSKQLSKKGECGSMGIDHHSARNLRQGCRELDRINRINMMLRLYIWKDRNPNDPVNLPEADKSCLILSSAGLCGSSDREGTGERYDHSAAFVCVGVARNLPKKPTGGAACWWTLSGIYVSVDSLFACSKRPAEQDECEARKHEEA